MVHNIVLPLIRGHLRVSIDFLSIANLSEACPIVHTNPSRTFNLRDIHLTNERDIKPGVMDVEKKNRPRRLIWICTIESTMLVKSVKHAC